MVNTMAFTNPEYMTLAELSAATKRYSQQLQHQQQKWDQLSRHSWAQNATPKSFQPPSSSCHQNQHQRMMSSHIHPQAPCKPPPPPPRHAPNIEQLRRLRRFGGGCNSMQPPAAPPRPPLALYQNVPPAYRAAAAAAAAGTCGNRVNDYSMNNMSSMSTGIIPAGESSSSSSNATVIVRRSPLHDPRFLSGRESYDEDEQCMMLSDTDEEATAVVKSNASVGSPLTPPTLIMPDRTLTPCSITPEHNRRNSHHHFEPLSVGSARSSHHHHTARVLTRRANINSNMITATAVPATPIAGNHTPPPTQSTHQSNHHHRRINSLSPIMTSSRADLKLHPSSCQFLRHTNIQHQHQQQQQIRQPANNRQFNSHHQRQQSSVTMTNSLNRYSMPVPPPLPQLTPSSSSNGNPLACRSVVIGSNSNKFDLGCCRPAPTDHHQHRQQQQQQQQQVSGVHTAPVVRSKSAAVSTNSRRVAFEESYIAQDNSLCSLVLLPPSPFKSDSTSSPSSSSSSAATATTRQTSNEQAARLSQHHTHQPIMTTSGPNGERKSIKRVSFMLTEKTTNIDSGDSCSESSSSSSSSSGTGSGCSGSSTSYSSISPTESFTSLSPSKHMLRASPSSPSSCKTSIDSIQDRIFSKIFANEDYFLNKCESSSACSIPSTCSSTSSSSSGYKSSNVSGHLTHVEASSVVVTASSSSSSPTKMPTSPPPPPPLPKFNQSIELNHFIETNRQRLERLKEKRAHLVTATSTVHIKMDSEDDVEDNDRCDHDDDDDHDHEHDDVDDDDSGAQFAHSGQSSGSSLDTMIVKSTTMTRVVKPIARFKLPFFRVGSSSSASTTNSVAKTAVPATKTTRTQATIITTNL